MAKVGVGASSRKVHLPTRHHVDSWLLASKITRTYHSKGKPWFTSLPRRLDLPMQAHSPSSSDPSESVMEPRATVPPRSPRGLGTFRANERKQSFARKIARKRQRNRFKTNQTGVCAQICVLTAIAHNTLLGRPSGRVIFQSPPQSLLKQKTTPPQQEKK